MYVEENPGPLSPSSKRRIQGPSRHPSKLIRSSARIFEQSTRARNQVGIGFIGWRNRFLGIYFWAPMKFKNTAFFWLSSQVGPIRMCCYCRKRAPMFLNFRQLRDISWPNKNVHKPGIAYTDNF
jgi:hypothetical protein